MAVSRYGDLVSERKRFPLSTILLGLVALALAAGGLFALRDTSTPTPIKEPVPAASSTATADTIIPERARQTLKSIDAGRWPADAHSPGTHGGDRWMNRGGQLPRTDAKGATIQYKEWDVNPKMQGHTRDAERIVTGSDGSAWYTGDHYKTFTRMRP